MDKERQAALQVTKEIVVKFIETGRISPTNFGEHFDAMFNDVLRTIHTSQPSSETESES
jgi:hypothetical protein